MSVPQTLSPRSSAERTTTGASALQTARSQHGVVTCRDLLAAGYSQSTLSRLAQRGILLRMHRGVYHVGLHPTWKSHLMAAVLAAGAGPALSHTSAAMAWGILSRKAEQWIHVTIPPERAIVRPGIRIHRTGVPQCDLTEWERIPITTPARTLADLSGSLSEAQLEMALALRAGLAQRAAVEESAARRTDPTGQAKLAKLLEQKAGPALTRSRAESLLLDHLRRSGLPAPTTNIRIEQWEVDFLWEATRLVLEVDGFAWHSSREAFEQDRLKDQWLEARGFRVLRFTWRQIQDHPLRTVTTIARMLPAET